MAGGSPRCINTLHPPCEQNQLDSALEVIQAEGQKAELDAEKKGAWGKMKRQRWV